MAERIGKLKEKIQHIANWVNRIEGKSLLEAKAQIINSGIVKPADIVDILNLYLVNMGRPNEVLAARVLLLSLYELDGKVEVYTGSNGKFYASFPNRHYTGWGPCPFTRLT